MFTRYQSLIIDSTKKMNPKKKIAPKNSLIILSVSVSMLVTFH